MGTLSSDTIRKAVELAPGWMLGIDEGDDNGMYIELADDTTWMIGDMPMYLHDVPQIFLDALAAELVRVVDATGTHVVHVHENYSEVSEHPDIMQYIHVTEGLGPDRTENTINAIVELSDKHPEVFSSE